MAASTLLSAPTSPAAPARGRPDRGERTVPVVRSDFATGLRVRPRTGRVGDFATGMCLSDSPVTRATGDFATGVRLRARRGARGGFATGMARG